MKTTKLTAVSRENTLSSKVESCMTLGMFECVILGILGGARTRL